jgi:polar amino acid transport system substrate-binding protein
VALLRVLGLAAAVGAMAVPTAGAEAGRAELVVGLHLPDLGFQVGAVSGDRITYAAGYEADLVRSLAPRLGAGTTALVQIDLDRIGAPGPKKWAVAIARLQPQAVGGAVYSVPYLRADPVVMTRRGLPSPAALVDLADVQLCAVATGKGRVVIANRIAPRVAPLVARDDEQLVGWIRTGRCDAAVREAAGLGVALTTVPGAAQAGRIVGRIDTGRAYAVALPRSSTLLPRINRALGALRANGTLHALAVRWLGFDPNRLRVIR